MAAKSIVVKGRLSVALLVLFLLLATSATVQADRHLYGMGINTDGQLGVINAYTPNLLMSHVSKCGTTNKFTIALTTGNKLFGFGDNSVWQLAMNTTKTPVSQPIEITSFASQGFTNATFKNIAVGDSHTLAIAEDGRVFGFGSNLNGQAGAGKFSKADYPVQISALDSKNISQVFAFGDSSFALSDSGNLWAWGSNLHLQLGLPRLLNDEPYYVPTEVFNSSDVRTVAGGVGFTFVILTDNTIYGMGDNSRAQLGLGFSSTEESIAQIEPLNDLNVVSIFAGGMTTFAQTSSNELYVFGDNTYGSSGLGSVGSMIATPTLVTTLGGTASTVSVGQSHTLVATTSGHVYGAGQNNRGKLGLFPSQTNMDYFTEIPVLAGLEISSLYTGLSHSAALLQNGSLLTWGEIRYSGQGYLLNTPTLSKFDTPYAFVYAGSDFSLGMEDTVGNLWGWGNNVLKPLAGDGDVARYEHFKHPTLDGVNITHIAVGGEVTKNFHILALSDNQTFYVWGSNHKYQLSLRTTNKFTLPTANPNIVNQTFTMLSAGALHSVSLAPDRILSGWGSNEAGQLGLGPNYPTKISPVLISEHVVSVATGYRHTIYVTATGEVFSIGDNTYGQLGLPLNSTSPYVNISTQVPLDVNATAVFAGGRCSFILAENGDLYAMGDNSHGTLGISNSTMPIVSTPTLVNLTITKPGVKDGSKQALKVVSSKFDAPGHTIVLSTGGEVWTFGDNSNGQLGLGESDSVFTPTKVDMQESALDVAAGNGFSLILTGSRQCLGAPLAECGGNRGYCDYVIGQCRCYTGYFGDRCEFITCEDKQNCNPPNGACDFNTGFCNCTSKYTGNSCEMRKCPNNCSNNGECNSTTGNCKCDDGWTGDDCSTEVSAAPPRTTLGVVVSLVAVVVSAVLVLAI